jgi:hypothetical protein
MVDLSITMLNYQRVNGRFSGYDPITKYHYSAVSKLSCETSFKSCSLVKLPNIPRKTGTSSTKSGFFQGLAHESSIATSTDVQ